MKSFNELHLGKMQFYEEATPIEMRAGCLLLLISSLLMRKM